MQEAQSYCKPIEQRQIESNITNRMLDPPLQGYNFNLKYVKSDENVCNYSNQHSDKDLLKFKELIHHVNFVGDDCTPNNLTIDVIRNSPKMINFYFKL